MKIENLQYLRKFIAEHADYLTEYCANPELFLHKSFSDIVKEFFRRERVANTTDKIITYVLDVQDIQHYKDITLDTGFDYFVSNLRAGSSSFTQYHLLADLASSIDVIKSILGVAIVEYKQNELKSVLCSVELLLKIINDFGFTKQQIKILIQTAINTALNSYFYNQQIEKGLTQLKTAWS